MGRGELILVVDDERHVREMTMTVLTRHGYRVLLASDGAEAAVLFSKNSGDIGLVITDLHMPNVDGAVLGRALRKIRPEGKLLVMSGMASSLATHSRQNPAEYADGVLHKPFKPEALLEKVYALLHPPALPVKHPAASGVGI
jgi:CheY-like chemotaxis protein